MDKELLKNGGIDVDGSIKRFVGNESLYLSLVGEFPSDNSFGAAQEAFNEKNYDTMYKCIHNMKSVTGNLGFEKLYLNCCELAKTIRLKKYDEVPDKFKSTIRLYEITCELIKKAE